MNDADYKDDRRRLQTIEQNDTEATNARGQFS